MSGIETPDNSLWLLNSQLIAPGTPGAPTAPGGTPTGPGTSHVQGEPNNIVTSEQFWALLNSSGVTGASGVGGAGKTSASGNANKYAGAMGRAFTMGAPPAPKAQTTPRTQAAYSSFQQEMNTAMASAKSAAPASPSATLPTAQQLAGATPAQAGQAAGTYLQNMMNNLQGAHNGLMLEFMKMRMLNSQSGVTDLQNMASLSSDLQGDTIMQQEAETKAAQEASNKAQKKAGILAIFKPLIAIVMAIISVVIAVCTLGTATGLAVLMAAMIAGFLAGGVAGAHGKGFNFTDAISGVGYAADAVLLATGIGEMLDTAVMMAETVANTVSKMAAKVGTRQGIGEMGESIGSAASAVGNGFKSLAEMSPQDLAMIAKNGAQSVQKFAGQTLGGFKQMGTDTVNGVTNGVKALGTGTQKAVSATGQAVKTLSTKSASEIGSDVAGAVKSSASSLKGTLSDAGSTISSDFKTVFGRSADSNVDTEADVAGNVSAKSGTEAGTSASTDDLGNLVEKEQEKTTLDRIYELMHVKKGATGKMLQEFANRYSAGVKAMVTKGGGEAEAAGVDAASAGTDAANAGTDAAAKTSTGAVDDLAAGKVARSAVGDRLIAANIAFAGLQAGTSLAQAGVEYAVSIPQTDAEADVAKIQLYQATGDMWNNNYNTIENTLSSLNDAHSKTVDQVNAMLNSSQQASLAVLTNIAHR